MKVVNIKNKIYALLTSDEDHRMRHQTLAVAKPHFLVLLRAEPVELFVVELLRVHDLGLAVELLSHITPEPNRNVVFQGLESVLLQLRNGKVHVENRRAIDDATESVNGVKFVILVTGVVYEGDLVGDAAVSGERSGRIRMRSVLRGRSE